jgi:hypothetical protein
MHLANEVKTITGMIVQKLYDLSMGNPHISHKVDFLFVALSNEAPHHIERSLFDSGLSYAGDRQWIECGEKANEVRITANGCNEVLVRFPVSSTPS